ncbi:MAG: hypothetical protein V1807_01155 [Patescibacteria group bacterium]
MKLFGKYKLDWWEIGSLKLAMFLLGIVVGAYWYSIWAPYMTILLVVGIVLALYLLYAWATNKL